MRLKFAKYDLDGDGRTPLMHTAVKGQLAVLIYEGALSFVTGMRCTYRDSPYKRECGRYNDRRPSSKPARKAPRSTAPPSPP